MRNLILALICLFEALPGMAAEIAEGDVATYRLSDKNAEPIDVQLRLSKRGANWLMETKEGRGAWRDISCDAGCTYRPSTPPEAATYLAAFPVGMHARFDIACIQNSAHAFCRLTKKLDAASGGYALVALVTGSPVPIVLHRQPE